MADETLAHEIRECSRCGKSKVAHRDNFSFIGCRNRWHSWCKACCAEHRRIDRAERPEHYRKIAAACIARNYGDVLERNRTRYHRERDRNVATMRKRMAANRDRYNANRRAKRAADAKAARHKAKLDREANRDRYRGYAKKSWAKASPQRRLRTYFTSAICHSLKGRTKGGRSWEAILGYSADELRDHLERQFTRGMSWDNYGDWHVDHIVPVVSFNFESADDPEFRLCWALTNLRPLWAADNLSKNDRRTHLI